MRTLLSVWTWLIIAVTVLVFFLLMVVLAVITFPFDRNRIVVGRTFRISSVVAARVSPFWRFGVRGEVPKRLPERVVVVSNHRSHTDPFLLSHLPWEMKWLGKKSLFKIPVLGWQMWLAGDIPVERGRAASGRDAMARAAAWVRRGVPVMIFPEGTRATTPELLPFKDGAFRLAIETGASILPLALWGTETALAKHDWRPRPARGWVVVGRPISTEGLTVEDVPRLKAQVREQIIHLLREQGARVQVRAGRPAEVRA